MSVSTAIIYPVFIESNLSDESKVAILIGLGILVAVLVVWGVVVVLVEKIRKAIYSKQKGQVRGLWL